MPVERVELSRFLRIPLTTHKLNVSWGKFLICAPQKFERKSYRNITYETQRAKCKLIKFLLLKSHDINTPCAFHASHSRCRGDSHVCAVIWWTAIESVCGVRRGFCWCCCFHFAIFHVIKQRQRAENERERVEIKFKAEQITQEFFPRLFFFLQVWNTSSRELFRGRGGMMKVSENDPYTLNGHEHRRCRHFHRWLCCVINSAVGLSRLD